MGEPSSSTSLVNENDPKKVGGGKYEPEFPVRNARKYIALAANLHFNSGVMYSFIVEPKTRKLRKFAALFLSTTKELDDTFFSADYFKQHNEFIAKSYNQGTANYFPSNNQNRLYPNEAMMDLFMISYMSTKDSPENRLHADDQIGVLSACYFKTGTTGDKEHPWSPANPFSSEEIIKTPVIKYLYDNMKGYLQLSEGSVASVEDYIRVGIEKLELKKKAAEERAKKPRAGKKVASKPVASSSSDPVNNENEDFSEEEELDAGIAGEKNNSARKKYNIGNQHAAFVSIVLTPSDWTLGSAKRSLLFADLVIATVKIFSQAQYRHATHGSSMHRIASWIFGGLDPKATEKNLFFADNSDGIKAYSSAAILYFARKICFVNTNLPPIISKTYIHYPLDDNRIVIAQSSNNGSIPTIPPPPCYNPFHLRAYELEGDKHQSIYSDPSRSSFCIPGNYEFNIFNPIVRNDKVPVIGLPQLLGHTDQSPWHLVAALFVAGDKLSWLPLRFQNLIAANYLLLVTMAGFHESVKTFQNTSYAVISTRFMTLSIVNSPAVSRTSYSISIHNPQNDVAEKSFSKNFFKKLVEDPVSIQTVVDDNDVISNVEFVEKKTPHFLTRSIPDDATLTIDTLGSIHAELFYKTVFERIPETTCLECGEINPDEFKQIFTNLHSEEILADLLSFFNDTNQNNNAAVGFMIDMSPHIVKIPMSPLNEDNDYDYADPLTPIKTFTDIDARVVRAFLFFILIRKANLIADFSKKSDVVLEDGDAAEDFNYNDDNDDDEEDGEDEAEREDVVGNIIRSLRDASIMMTVARRTFYASQCNPCIDTKNTPIANYIDYCMHYLGITFTESEKKYIGNLKKQKSTGGAYVGHTPRTNSQIDNSIVMQQLKHNELMCAQYGINVLKTRIITVGKMHLQIASDFALAKSNKRTSFALAREFIASSPDIKSPKAFSGEEECDTFYDILTDESVKIPFRYVDLRCLKSIFSNFPTPRFNQGYEGHDTIVLAVTHVTLLSQLVSKIESIPNEDEKYCAFDELMSFNYIYKIASCNYRLDTIIGIMKEDLNAKYGDPESYEDQLKNKSRLNKIDASLVALLTHQAEEVDAGTNSNEQRVNIVHDITDNFFQNFSSNFQGLIDSKL